MSVWSVGAVVDGDRTFSAAEASGATVVPGGVVASGSWWHRVPECIVPIVDINAGVSDYVVYEDPSEVPLHCVLGCPTANPSNDKFFVIQLLASGDGTRHALFTRWGRAGSPGQRQLVHMSLEACVQGFKRKFLDKTRTRWEDRVEIEAQPAGRYFLGAVACSQAQLRMALMSPARLAWMACVGRALAFRRAFPVAVEELWAHRHRGPCTKV